MKIVLDILRYLKLHNITLAKVADVAGVAPQNIKKSLMANPKASTILTIANGLGVHPREFFYETDENGNIIEDAPLEASQDEQPTDTTQEVQTVAYCPHCGGKVQVGVVLV